MLDRIPRELARLEAVEDVRVLLAVESGSRAWGFASRDSDWDVRFVYARPLDWYLSIERRRDVIELPIEDGLDLSGWDLPKALRLFRKGNPPLLEWLRSPMVYRDSEEARHLRGLQDRYFRPLASMHHYRAMAKKNYREYLQRGRVRLKKYFYVLRPLLACAWVQRHGGPPPMEFDRLLEEELGPGPLREAIEELLRSKRAGDELGMGPQRPLINHFVEERLARLEANLAGRKQAQPPAPGPLDELFRAALLSVR